MKLLLCKFTKPVSIAWITCASFSIALSACVSEDRSDSKLYSHKTGSPNADMPDEHRFILSAFTITEASSAEDLMLSANLLKQAGAKPIANTPNLAEEWAVKATEISPDIAKQHPSFRGRVKGPAYRQYSLAPNTSERFDEVFYAAEIAMVSMLAEQAGLALSVLIAERSVCNIASQSQSQTCSWTPLYTSAHTFVVENTSNEIIDYVIVAN